jgi:hypothetical protein
MFRIVILAKSGHEVNFSAIQLGSRSWFIWMPDQVRHDGEHWIGKEGIN